MIGFFRKIFHPSFWLFFVSLIVALLILLFNEAVWFHKNTLHQDLQLLFLKAKSLESIKFPPVRERQRIFLKDKPYDVRWEGSPPTLVITQETPISWETIQEETLSQHFWKEALYSLKMLLPPVSETALRLKWSLKEEFSTSSSPQKTLSIMLTFAKAPLHRALWQHISRKIPLCLAIALMIAFFAWSINYVTNIRPLRVLDRHMEGFDHNPLHFRFQAHFLKSYFSKDILHLGRTFDHLRKTLHTMLIQREHLASLGNAMMKITHDIKNMMASLQLFLQSIPPAQNIDEKKARNTMLSVVEHMLHFCLQTLNYGREGHALEGSPMPINKHLNLQNVLSKMIIPYQKMDIDITCIVAKNHTIAFPENALMRILSNLLANSSQALSQMPQGQRSIVFSSHKKDKTIELSVKDSGPGIPSQTRKTLFRPFFASNKQGSVGLGLTIIKELMTSYGGCVKLLKTGSDGTTFLCSFPTLSV